MTWQWVALILGVLFNSVIVIVAMSPGAQYRMGAVDGREAVWRAFVDFQKEISESETTRSSGSDA